MTGWETCNLARLAMTARGAAVLVENSSALPLVGLLIPETHHVGILSACSFGHGASFPVLGDRALDAGNAANLVCRRHDLTVS